MSNINKSEIESMGLRIKENMLLLVFHIYKSRNYLKPENNDGMKITEGKLTVEYAPNYTVPMTITVYWFPDYKSKELYRETFGNQKQEYYSNTSKTINVEVDYIDNWFDFWNVMHKIVDAVADGYIDYMRNVCDKHELNVCEGVFLNAIFPSEKFGTNSDPYELGRLKPLTENRIRLY